MINQKIIQYIQQNIDAGHDMDAIKSRLIDNGYPQNDVDDTIDYVKQQSENSRKANYFSKFKGFGVIISSTIIILIVAIALGIYFFIGGSDADSLTGQTAATTESIYEDGNFTAEELDVDGTIRPEDNIQWNETGEEFAELNETLDTAVIEENISDGSFNETNATTEEQITEEKIEEFKFSPNSIVATQNNISISLDYMKHEIKSEYWGKIIELTSTVLNKGNYSFKPKLLVLLYDEKDFKEEWLKPKAEIEFDIEKLNPGEHTERQAIVSISFDDIALPKNFKLVLVDAADPANKPLVVVEKEFKAIG